MGELEARSIASLVRENELVKVAGKVMRVFETRGGSVYTIFDESGGIEVVADYEARKGELLEVTGKTCLRGEALQVLASEVKTLHGAEAERMGRGVDAALERQAAPLDSEFLIKDRVMEEMRPDIEKAARIIRKAVLEMRPIMIKHHNDCDGISGGMLIKIAVSSLMEKENFNKEMKMRLLNTSQNNSAIYDSGDALKDINIFRSIESGERPLCVLVDFSSNADSIDSLSLLRGANSEIVLIDHHPTDAEMRDYVDCFVSPWAHSGDSDYSAGFLAGEVAKKVFKIDAEDIQKIALIGDKSRFVEPFNVGEELRKKALVLDFLGTHSKFPNTLDFYEEAFSNKSMMDSLYQQASDRIARSTKVAMEHVRIRKLENGFMLCLARLDKAVKKGEFPGKGKLTGQVHDEVELTADAPLITVGYGGSSINFRADRRARDKGFDAGRLIANLKVELKNAVASGGGHDVAAGLIVNKGFNKIVLEEIIKNIEAIKTN